MSIYLDYNATAPLSEKVKSALLGSDIIDANPSSQHSLGKSALKSINEVTDTLYKCFHLNSQDFQILYHSGATEAANTFLNLDHNSTLLFSSSDHPCVTRLIPKLTEQSVNCVQVHLDSVGQYKNLEEILAKYQGDETWLHFTWMHNETGVVQDLQKILQLKEKYQFKLYVDAVQTVAKIQGWNKLSELSDVYTYSGHKFGALKGIGFSFFRKDLKIRPLILGGQQQNGLRSGTQNLHGILSLKYALEDIRLNTDNLLNLKNEMIMRIEQSGLKTIANDSFNTICFLHPTKKADELLIHFDLNGLCVSSGSACSSGSIEPSKTLVAMGFEDLAKNSIRISLGEKSLEQADEILHKLDLVLKKISHG